MSGEESSTETTEVEDAAASGIRACQRRWRLLNENERAPAPPKVVGACAAVPGEAGMSAPLPCAPPETHHAAAYTAGAGLELLGWDARAWDSGDVRVGLFGSTAWGALSREQQVIAGLLGFERET